MRIVLINPDMNVRAGFGEFAEVMEPMPCIGVAYLAASLRRGGHEVLCIDNFALGLSFDELLRRIDDFKADVVGQTCLTPTAKVSFDFNGLIRRTSPRIRTILGNVHAGAFAREIIDGGLADFVLEGECEHSLPAFLDRLEAGRPIDDVPGLHYRDHMTGLYACAGPPEPVTDLDSLPRPDWGGLPWRKYTFLPFVTIARPVMAIMGSRGCPYKCTFCALSYQGKYRTRDPEAIADEMEWLVRDFSARHIGFVDPLYPLSKEHLLRLCDAIRGRSLQERTAWTSETRVDAVDEEMLRAMKSAGYRRLLLGIESGSDRLLATVRKDYTVDQVRECVRIARKVGIETSCFFILGLPGETRAEAERTSALPIELDVDFAKFSILIPLPGSRLYNELVEQGNIRADDWAKFTTFNPDPDDLPYVPEGMTGAELLALQKRANLAFYFRPRIILRHLFKVRTIPWRSLLAGLMIWLRWRYRAARP